MLVALALECFPELFLDVFALGFGHDAFLLDWSSPVRWSHRDRTLVRAVRRGYFRCGGLPSYRYWAVLPLTGISGSPSFRWSHDRTRSAFTRTATRLFAIIAIAGSASFV